MNRLGLFCLSVAFLAAPGVRAYASAGGVTLSTSVFVTGDTMQILEHGQKTRFIGHVTITSHDADIVWKAYGEKGLYDSKDNTMTLWGAPSKRARVIRHPKNEPSRITLEMYGDTLKTDSTTTFFHAEGNTYGIDISTSTHQFLRFWAASTDYNQARSLIRLEGERPLMIIDKPTERRSVTGTTIRYLINERRLIAEGKAVSKIEPGPHSFQ